MEERLDYINAITKIADESYDRIKTNDFSDILRWSRNEVYFKLIPKIKNVEKKALMLEKKTLAQAGISFWKDGIPAIGSALISNGIKNAKEVAAEKFLDTIVSTLGDKFERRYLRRSFIIKVVHRPCVI